MLKFKFVGAVAIGLLTGCGAEVASTAVTAGKLQATQVEQAKAQEALIKKKLEEAMKAPAAAAASAAYQ